MSPKLLALVVGPAIGFGLAVVVLAFDLGSTATLFVVVGVAVVSALVLVPLSFSFFQRPRRGASIHSNGSIRTAGETVDWKRGEQPAEGSERKWFGRSRWGGSVRSTP